MTADKKSDSLTPELILSAYRMGFFPMAESRSGPIFWYSPDPRTIIPLERFHCPRSLRQTLKKGLYDVRIDMAFGEVIEACADRQETWISAEIVRAYCQLHRLGYAHSMESWREGRLAGGLYGVAIGGAFFGESMFARETDASKVALAVLVGRLRERGFTLLDSQFMNEHIRQFGAVEIPQRAYIERLRHAVAAGTTFVDPV